MQTRRSTERGSANLKFLIVMAIICSSAYAGYIYVPVAYSAHNFKEVMQHYVDVASAQGKPSAWVAEQLKTTFGEYDVPPDATITHAVRENRIEVRVQFVKPIEFPGYTYNYEFDQTVKSTAFLDFSK
jgi:uncharacterized iron-regulated protein